jgi:dGTPase
MDGIRRISKDLIYNNPRLKYFKDFAKLMLESIFEALSSCYKGEDTLTEIQYKLKHCYLLRERFPAWIVKYTKLDQGQREKKGYKNKIVYDISDKHDYYMVVIDYIAGMTDKFALNVFAELTRFM